MNRNHQIVDYFTEFSGSGRIEVVVVGKIGLNKTVIGKKVMINTMIPAADRFNNFQIPLQPLRISVYGISWQHGGGDDQGYNAPLSEF